MLILERRIGTAVRIGDDISVEVHQIRSRSTVKLAIRAPRDISIMREEIAPISEDQPPASLNEGYHDFRVTVIEDNPGHADLIKYALNDNGITNITLHSRGQAAIDHFSDSVLSKVKPSLILLDYSLPDMTGFDILCNLRTRDEYRATPVVMLSSSNNDQHVAMCLDQGANAFMVKGIKYDEMKESIGRITAFWTRTKLVA